MKKIKFNREISNNLGKCSFCDASFTYLCFKDSKEPLTKGIRFLDLEFCGDCAPKIRDGILRYQKILLGNRKYMREYRKSEKNREHLRKYYKEYQKKRREKLKIAKFRRRS